MSEGEQAGGRKETTARSAPGMAQSWALLGMLFLLGLVVQHALGGQITAPGGRRVSFVVAGLLVFAATVAAGLRPRWLNRLASNRFAVPCLLALTGLSVLGTLILQGEPPAVLERAYGELTAPIRSLFLDDLFHSIGFAAVMGAGAGGLALTLCRRRRLTLRRAGALGAHAGLLVVLAGAAVGNVWVVKGRLELREGERAEHFQLDLGGGRVGRVPLGFAVALEDFEIDFYEPEYELVVLRQADDGREPLAEIDPAQPDRQALEELGLRIVGFWPDHRRRELVEPLANAAEPARPAVPAALGLELPGEEGSATHWLLADAGGRSQRLALDDSALVFVWSAEQAERIAAAAAGGPASPHRLLLGDQQRPVRVGQQIELPDGRALRVLRFWPDFVIDPQTKKPTNRSQQPRNPVLEVELPERDGPRRAWLFARFPDFHHRGQDHPLAGVRYSYEPAAAEPPAALVVGERRALWRLTDGAVVERRPLAAGDAIALSGRELRVAALWPAARRRLIDESASERQRNPLLRLARRGSDQTAELRPGRPLRLGDGRVAALVSARGEPVRDYLSRLSIWEGPAGGRRKVAEELVEVNYPLEHRGFVFYQADYRPDDPHWSGFQVVRDSGLGLVYAGFGIHLTGVLLVVFGPVMLRRWRRRQGADR